MENLSPADFEDIKIKGRHHIEQEDSQNSPEEKTTKPVHLFEAVKKNNMSADVVSLTPPEDTGNGMDALDSGDDLVESKNGCGLMTEVDSEEEVEMRQSPPGAEVVPSNTPVNGNSGQVSPVMQSSSESVGEKTAPMISAESKAAPEINARRAVKEAKKEEKKKNKKREDKGIEYILRALNSLQTPEEKLAALCKKYADLHEEHRVLQSSFKTQQRTMAVVMREKDGLQSEHTKAIMAKSKLESLCRELQKQNKIIKDESIKRAREEDERRKEISAQFQTTIGEIQAQMNDNTERNTKLRQENAELAVQLQSIIKQCDLREQQVDKVRKQHDLENQLSEAKLNKSDLMLKEERERNGKEKELLLSKFTEQAKKNSMLEAQVEMFKERYDDFEKLHSRSSETFQKYKTEMDKMTKRIKKLEKDGGQWKTKWENSNKALLEMIDARTKSEKETITYVQKCKKLESLCRALQAELHGKKPPAPEPVTPAPAQTSGSMDDIDHPTKEDEVKTPSAAPPNSPESSGSNPSSSAQSTTKTSTAQPPSISSHTSSSSLPSEAPSAATSVSNAETDQSGRVVTECAAEQSASEQSSKPESDQCTPESTQEAGAASAVSEQQQS